MCVRVQHVDGRWFLLAKDSASRRTLVARFHRHELPPLHIELLRIAGSPFAGDASTLLVLLLVTCLVLQPMWGGDDAGGIGPMRRRSSVDTARAWGAPAPEQLGAVLPFELDPALLMRAALMLSLIFSFSSRLLAKWADASPPRSTYAAGRSLSYSHSRARTAASSQ